MNDDFIEPMLRKSLDRLSLFPIKHEDIWEFYKKMTAVYWTVEEVLDNLQEDKKHWETLKDNEKRLLKEILGFFAAADAIVNENLSTNFNDEIQWPEARAFYSFQQSSETIHNETYNLLIDTYIKDVSEKNELFNSIQNNPFIKKKADWAFSWMNRDKSFPERLVAFACLEGIFFSSSFAVIFWFKNRCILPGLCFSNELISRDEGLHCDFACLIYKKLERKLSQETIQEIIQTSVELEIEFIKNAIPSELIGLNSNLMSEYIKFCGDRLLVALGYEKIYKCNNPLDFMEKISLEGKANFFERGVSNYSKNGVGVDPKDQIISFDEDF